MRIPMMCALAIVGVGLTSQAVEAQAEAASHSRGLLASPPFAGLPMKSVFFFPGEGAAYNSALYTAHPQSASDLRWNSDPGTRSGVIDRIVATGANTIIMSYWGDEMLQWSPMAIDATSVRGVIEAVAGKPVGVIPALESGHDPTNPARPHWRFAEDFPYEGGTFASSHLAPSLLKRLRTICALFEGRREAWSRMYDRRGRPRHVVHVLNAYAQSVPAVVGKTPDEVVAEAFDRVAAEIHASEGIEIGFTLDPGIGELGSHSLRPEGAAALERADSVLAIQLFLSEIQSGRAQSGPPWGPAIDNNLANLDALISGKLAVLDGWLRTGIPVVYDVSSGFDGRFVWAPYGTGFWGDNYEYTSDDWRNLQSEHKNRAFVGITFNTWNGYTEGYAAVPTTEHGTSIYDWLTDLYEPDPRDCNHVEYEAGRASVRVSGEICTKWRALGGSGGMLGAPTSDERTTVRGRVGHFEAGSIFITGTNAVHEVHGAIHDEYERLGYDASCLGLPTTDEQRLTTGWISHFEHGVITFERGAAKAHASCSKRIDTP